jgi:hypothetical protein
MDLIYSDTQTSYSITQTSYSVQLHVQRSIVHNTTISHTSSYTHSCQEHVTMQTTAIAMSQRVKMSTAASWLILYS